MSVKKIFVIANLDKDLTAPILKEIKIYFEKREIQLVWYSFENNVPVPDLQDVDLAISIGGDGTLLYCAGIVASKNIPILAVNLGTFGFITEISSDEWKHTYESFADGRLGISKRIMIRAEVCRNKEVVGSFLGLNDAVIGTLGISRLIELKLFLSGSYVGRYRADGVIVATPTGSTAYSMGAGGPILHPEMEAFVLNPICPFTLSNRPLVVPADGIIEIEVEEGRKAEVMLTVDGSNPFPLKSGDRVAYKKNPKKSLIIRSDKRGFYEVLRSKLNWSGEPNA
jgi:NAD+ kinase